MRFGFRPPQPSKSKSGLRLLQETFGCQIQIFDMLKRCSQSNVSRFFSHAPPWVCVDPEVVFHLLNQPASESHPYKGCISSLLIYLILGGHESTRVNMIQRLKSFSFRNFKSNASQISNEIDPQIPGLPSSFAFCTLALAAAKCSLYEASWNMDESSDPNQWSVKSTLGDVFGVNHSSHHSTNQDIEKNQCLQTIKLLSQGVFLDSISCIRCLFPRLFAYFNFQEFLIYI